MQQHKFITFARSLALLSSTTVGCTASLGPSLTTHNSKPVLANDHPALEKRRGTPAVQTPTPTPQTCSADVFMGRTRQCSAGNRCFMGNPANPTGECNCSPQGTWRCQPNANLTNCPYGVDHSYEACTLGDHCKPTWYYQTGECWCLPATGNTTRWSCHLESRSRRLPTPGPFPPPDLPA